METPDDEIFELCKKIREAFLDLLDGTLEPGEIQSTTGLSFDRCEEILSLRDYLLSPPKQGDSLSAHII